jgi:hypothetical protein
MASQTCSRRPSRGAFRSANAASKSFGADWKYWRAGPKRHGPHIVIESSVYLGGAESSAGPESHAVASIASIPDTPIARNSMRSLSGLPMN